MIDIITPKEAGHTFDIYHLTMYCTAGHRQGSHAHCSETQEPSSDHWGAVRKDKLIPQLATLTREVNKRQRHLKLGVWIDMLEWVIVVNTSLLSFVAVVTTFFASKSWAPRWLNNTNIVLYAIHPVIELIFLCFHHSSFSCILRSHNPADLRAEIIKHLARKWIVLQIISC